MSIPQTPVPQEPPRCVSGDLIISVVDWNSQGIAWKGAPGKSLYRVILESQNREITHDFHREPTLVVQDVEPGKVGLEFVGDVEGLAASLEHLPVPTYDQADVDHKNGNTGALPSPGTVPACFGCPVRDQLIKDRLHPCRTVAPSKPLPPYGPEAWISHAERDTREAKKWYHVFPYSTVAQHKTGPAIILPVDLKQTHQGRRATYHVVELTGRYAYVPWLEETTATAYVNAANLAALAELAYGTLGANENRGAQGSIGDVFRKMENFERPDVCNASPSTLILRAVPYALRYKTEDVTAVTCDRTQFNAFLAFSPESAILGVSGLGRECYGPARGASPQWKAANNYRPLPFMGATMYPTIVEAIMAAVDAGLPSEALDGMLSGAPSSVVFGGGGLHASSNRNLPEGVRKQVGEALRDQMKDSAVSQLEDALKRNQIHRGVYHAVFGLWEQLSWKMQNLPQVPVFVGASCFGGPAGALLGGRNGCYRPQGLSVRLRQPHGPGERPVRRSGRQALLFLEL